MSLNFRDKKANIPRLDFFVRKFKFKFENENKFGLHRNYIGRLREFSNNVAFSLF